MKRICGPWSVMVGASRVLWCLAVMGCKSDDRGGVNSIEAMAATEVILDGVEIIMNEAPQWGSRTPLSVRWDSARTLGGSRAEGPEAFGNVVGVVGLDEGQIIVADDATKQLTWFDGSGAVVRTFGRLGAGPGEFEDIGGLTRGGGDTLTVWDARLRRVTMLTTDGELIGTRVLDAEIWSPLGRGQNRLIPVVIGVSADGTVLGRTDTDYGDWNDGVTQDSVWIVFDRAGGEDFLKGPIGGQDLFFLGNSRMIAPFGRGFYWTVEDDWIHVGSGDPFEVMTFDSEGSVVRIVTLATSREPVTRNDVERYKEITLSRIVERSRQRMIDRLNNVDYPSLRPFYSGLISDVHGFLWVSRYRLADEPKTFEIISPEGRWLGHIEAPVEIGRILYIESDYIVTLKKDDLGADILLVYQLSRG